MQNNDRARTNRPKALFGEAQYDAELGVAFRERWIMPRREMARQAIERGIREKSFRATIDIELAIDMLYAPIYYRLQIGTGPLSDEYADAVFTQVVRGLRLDRDK
ncbi:MAG: TetR-like C-terminal domain-containing protein [Gemmatimonas sp.]